MTTDSGNGIKEAIDTLKSTSKDFSARLLMLEKEGSPTHGIRITILEKECDIMNKKIDELRMFIAKLVGASAVVTVVGSLIANWLIK